MMSFWFFKKFCALLPWRKFIFNIFRVSWSILLLRARTIIWVNRIRSSIKQKTSFKFLQNWTLFLMKSHELFFALFKSRVGMHILFFSFYGTESFITRNFPSGIINRGRSRDFKKRWCSMLTTMVGRPRKC